MPGKRLKNQLEYRIFITAQNPPVDLKTGVPRVSGAQTSFSAAAAALRRWQVDTRPYDIKGWLLWTWDTEEPEQVPPLRATMSGDGSVNKSLAPAFRPDPCQ